MRAYRAWIGATFAAALLAGCATPARIEQMAAAPQPMLQPVNPALRNSVSVADITGGRETNPLWTSQVSTDSFHRALEISLQNAGLLERLVSRSRFRLTADILRVDQPFAGIDMTVSSTVRYSLVETASRKEIYGRTITVSYTARFSDALMGAERLKLANEGAIKKNIEHLIGDLGALKLQ